MIKNLIRRLIPGSFMYYYHYCLARSASFVYGNPSKDLIVIGVTGTNGKSSTVQYIGQILEGLGDKVGWTTTVSFKIGEKEWVNDHKMTMLGRFKTQKLLREMVSAGCAYAVVETSSQGILQSRHVGIDYDVAVFTNLTPEHIEAHGGFENYKKAKGELFRLISGLKIKEINNHKIIKASVVNLMDEHSDYFLGFNAGKLYGYTDNSDLKDGVEVINAQNVIHSLSGTTFDISNSKFNFTPIGRFNFENILAAISACYVLGFGFDEISNVIKNVNSVEGRLEIIDLGQDFTVIVDYAYEPAGLSALYKTLDLFEHNNVIHVVGSAGGGRDVARRQVLGKMCAKHDGIVVVTNEDPYDEDPMIIINDVASSAKSFGKIDGKDLFRILDRREAIEKAITLAKKGDIVLITGKGSEPVMAVANGKKIAWDDRVVVKDILNKTINRYES